MSYLVACNCQGRFSQHPRLPEIGRKLRKLARAALVGLMLLAGSVVVVTSWMPVQQASTQEAELYLQDPAAAPVVRKDLSDSISASTVLGSSLR